MAAVNPHLSQWLKEFSGQRSWGPLGPLEYAVMTVLWARSPAIARDVRRHFPTTAYTTIMTTLDRLYKKGLLERQPSGRAYAYRPTMSRLELQAAIVDCLLASSF